MDFAAPVEVFLFIEILVAIDAELGVDIHNLSGLQLVEFGFQIIVLRRQFIHKLLLHGHLLLRTSLYFFSHLHLIIQVFGLFFDFRPYLLLLQIYFFDLLLKI